MQFPSKYIALAMFQHNFVLKRAHKTGENKVIANQSIVNHFDTIKTMFTL